VLQRDLRAGDLALVGEASELPRKLRALRQAGRAQRMTLGDEPARGVDDPLAAVGDSAFVDQVAAFALAAETESLIGDEFVR